MPDESFDEQACLQRLAAGDEAAAREFLQHFHPLVLRLVRSHLPRRVSEEDLTQMIFIKLFQKLDRYSGKAPLPHWISRVAVNTCINELRAEKRRPEWRMSDFDESTAAVIEQLARTENEPPSPQDEQAAKYLLEKLLARLSPNDRLLMNLLYLEERSVKEVRDITGWSQASIKVRAFRARARMKRMLGQNRIAHLHFRMKSTEEFLTRVFKLARPARAPLPNELPYGLETVVLAHWRAAVADRSGNGFIVRGLRWAAVCACLIALLAGVWSNDQISAFRNRFDPEANVADSAVVSGYDYE